MIFYPITRSPLAAVLDRRRRARTPFGPASVQALLGGGRRLVGSPTRESPYEPGCKPGGVGPDVDMEPSRAEQPEESDAGRKGREDGLPAVRAAVPLDGADRAAGEEPEGGEERGRRAERPVGARIVERGDRQVSRDRRERKQEPPAPPADCREHRRKGEDPAQHVRDQVPEVRVEKQRGAEPPPFTAVEHGLRIQRTGVLQAAGQEALRAIDRNRLVSCEVDK